MSTLYTNQIRVSISEVARLTFSEQTQDGLELVIEVSMTNECLKHFYDTIGQTLQANEAQLAKQKEINKGMN